MELIKEGKALIKLPFAPKNITSDMPVFYNPNMKINRDITVLVVRYLYSLLKRPLKVADPLAGSGIRSLRLLKETEVIERVFVNDIKSSHSIKENFEINEIDPEKYNIYSKEANLFLREEGRFDYIDIDPFGTPVPFLESSIISLSRKGILGVTATDTAPLSGTYPETCIRRYGSKPLKSEFYHEVGIRILIHKVFLTGASYDCSMMPVLSYSHLHHFRVFFIKEKGARKTNKNIEENVGYIVYCHECLYRKAANDLCALRKCPKCGSKMDYAGPLWIGSINRKDIIEFAYRTADTEVTDKRTIKLLSLLIEESDIDLPYFYTLSSLSRVLKKGKVPNIKEVIKELNGVRTHFSGEGFKTLLDFDRVIEKFVVL